MIIDLGTTLGTTVDEMELDCGQSAMVPDSYRGNIESAIVGSILIPISFPPAAPVLATSTGNRHP
jgi:hypothetical protein